MIYCFGSFELDPARAELRAEGESVPLEPQVFALLALLVDNRGRLVSRDEIIEKVWNGRIVADSAISSRVKSARRALGDDGKAQRFIRTIHGKGFRFVAATRIQPEDPPSVAIATHEPEPLRDASGMQSTAAGQPQGPPSIAVLPFRLIGAEGPRAAIADALPHELIAELARLRWLLVTARGSSFRLREFDADVIQVGQLLGVRYCLSGTVETTGTKLLVTVELADTRDGHLVWAERFDAAVDDVHRVRGEIRSQVLTQLEIRIPAHEAMRARLGTTESLDSWSAYHLALQHMYRFNLTDNAVAGDLFARAIALDAGFARAHAGLSFVHFQKAFLRQTDDTAAQIALARRSAERGFELDPLDPFVNFTLGRSYWLEGDLDTSLSWLERATAISPNYAQGIYARAWTESLSERGAAAREHADLAMKLSPLDPLHYAMQGTRAFAHMAMDEDELAAPWAERAAIAPGAHVLIAMIAVAAHALVGNEERATHWAKNVRRRNPSTTAEDFFHAFPMKSEPMKRRVAGALERFGF